MTEFDDFHDWPGGEGKGAATGDGHARHYDPLFPDWQDGAPDAPLSSASIFADDIAWQGGQSGWEEVGAERRAVPTGRPSSWYAGDWGTAQFPQITDAQRRLREGVITIPRPERKWTVTIRELAETLLLAALIFLSVRASFQNFRVEGASMYPSLENGEYLIVNKLSYARIDLGPLDFLPFFDAGDQPRKFLWGEPHRGDVIVFRAPTSPNRDFIKRIIGVPGDTIEIRPDGTVLVNGTALQEPYIKGTTNCTGSECIRTLPAAGSPEARAECGSGSCYFVMGDNRQNSSDSRQGWLVPEENIIGKALITYWHHGKPELDLAPNHSVSANEPGR